MIFINCTCIVKGENEKMKKLKKLLKNQHTHVQLLITHTEGDRAITTHLLTTYSAQTYTCTYECTHTHADTHTHTQHENSTSTTQHNITIMITTQRQHEHNANISRE